MPGSLGPSLPLLGVPFGSGAAGFAYAGTLTQGAMITDTVIGSPGVTLTASVTISEATATVVGKILFETANITEALAGAGIYGALATQGALATDLPQISIPAALAEAITATDAMSVLAGVYLAERVTGQENLLPALTYGLSVSESVLAIDTLLRFFGSDIEEIVNVSDALTPLLKTYETVTDLSTVTEAIAPSLVMRVVVEDETQVTLTQLLNAIYMGDALHDVVEITGGYFLPGDGATTWVMNTRTGFVTEYNNFVFNSFASRGHVYMAASNQGLYELLGDTDDGADIISRIKSGFMRFGQMKFSSIKGTYIGARGDGDYVLRIITGDGKTYDYAAVAKDMETVRVRMGKGLRAHYFAFELISEGQDFDFDAIEFIPIVADRRV